MHVVKASQCSKSIKSNAMNAKDTRSKGARYDELSCVLQYGPLTWFGIVAVHLFSTPTEVRSNGTSNLQGQLS